MSRTMTARGRAKDAIAAQAAILDAAEAAFADHGFAGARIDAIAEASGYNKSLIFHYFDDKLGLYTAVLRRADQQGKYLHSYLLDLIDSDAAVTATTFREFVGQLVGATFDYFLAHPRLVRILAWEEAAGWATMQEVASELDLDDVAQYTAFLERAQRVGALRPNVTLPFILHVMVNFCRNYLTSLSLFQLIAPAKDPARSEGFASAREQIVSFIVHGLTVDPPSQAPDSEVSPVH
ncbi:MAG TPA: TetR family transcriptional regulator [Chloroflexota bacterium]|nr:TetR family transcriptional regulator [Chloroflexota bacterium]